MAGGLPLPQAQWVLAASVKGAMVRGQTGERVDWRCRPRAASCEQAIRPPPSHHLHLTTSIPPPPSVQAMRPRLGTELEEATAEWMQAAAAARRARHAAAAKERSNIVMYAAAATAAPLLGASMLLAAAALGMTGGGPMDFA